MTTDDDLRARVILELTCDATIDGRTIGVAARYGVVILSGVVECWSHKHAAERAAYRVASVRDVANDIQIRPAWCASRCNAEIANAVREALTRDHELGRQVIRVAVTDCGSVTLAGVVDTPSACDDAVRVVRGVAGVHFVTNELVVDLPAMTADELRAAIRGALARHAVREVDKLEIALDGDTVVLSGTVESPSERRAVVGVVRGTRGVKRLDDRMQVAGPC